MLYDVHVKVKCNNHKCKLWLSELPISITIIVVYINGLVSSMYDYCNSRLTDFLLKSFGSKSIGGAMYMSKMHNSLEYNMSLGQTAFWLTMILFSCLLSFTKKYVNTRLYSH